MNLICRSRRNLMANCKQESKDGGTQVDDIYLRSKVSCHVDEGGHIICDSQIEDAQRGQRKVGDLL